MKLISIFLCALLVGCGGMLTKSAVTADVPVLTTCIKNPVTKPAWLLDTVDVTRLSLFEKGVTALREIEQRRAYEAELEAAITACTARIP